MIPVFCWFAKYIKTLALSFGIFLAISMNALSNSVDIYVTPSGNDRNPGTQSEPLATLEAAREAARPHAGKSPVTIHLADGTYYLTKPLILHPEDSGTSAAPVVFRATNEGGAVISGGVLLDLKWEPWRDGIYQAEMPAGLSMDQLFINGKRMWMARYPDFDPDKTTAAYQGFAADAFSKKRAAGWKDPAGGFIHAMHSARWGGYHYRITGKHADGTIAYEGGWQNNRQMGMHPEFRMVENIFEELDGPGEWFHDQKQNRLYFYPPEGLDLSTARVEAVRLAHLVELRGTVGHPVSWISFEGFVFRHSARTFMENREPLLRSDWTIYRGGAVLISGARDIAIRDCEFDQVGGNAIFIDRHARRILIRGCHIHDPGACGIAFVGDPGAVRNPLFEYGQTQDLSTLDLTPGPQNEDYPSDCTVEDCLIHGVGRVERQAAGVQIAMSARITVRDSSIYECSRAGINIGDGNWGGHLLEGLDVFDTVLETHDHGSFNSWGRDRYWTPNHREASEPAVKGNPGLPFLDAVETTRIRNSRWRCDHGWDIDLDDGSSNYDITNNLMLAGGLKLREGYRRHAWNNILINNGLHPHVWFDTSDDRFFSNIVMAAPAPVRQPEGWAKHINRNFFVSANDLQAARKHGADADSTSGDPQFLNPATGDFRVAHASPALAVGFQNFPMDQFGVKKPSLRAMARTPKFPQIRTRSESAQKLTETTTEWIGATVRNLTGEEFSAFGVSRESGGVQVLKIAQGSIAARLGLRVNDLIQGFDGQAIKTTADLVKFPESEKGVSLKVIRDQQPLMLEMRTMTD